MIKKSQKPFILVKSSSELAALAGSMENKKFLAVDLEADSMFHFREQVCLIQMSDGEQPYLIDPLQVKDLEPLKPIFANPGTQKVLHGADYDIRSLFRDFSIEIENLFDTELACRFLGYRETGLDAVLSSCFKVQLDKKYQKKDWSQRPLPEEMLEYAAQDVAYLIPLAKKLQQELEQCNRMEWVREECRLLSQVRAASVNDMPLFMRISGAGRLDSRSLGMLEAMLEFRSNIAEKKDRPVFKILSNRSLLLMAKAKPVDMDQMMALNILSPKQLEMYGVPLLNIIRRILKVDSGHLPRYPRHNNSKIRTAVPEEMRKLKDWRDKQAETLALDPAMLFNKNQLSTIAMANPSTLEELRDIPNMRNWQVNSFGAAILSVLADCSRPSVNQ